MNPVGNLIQNLYQSTQENTHLLGIIAKNTQSLLEKSQENKSGSFSTNLAANLIGSTIIKSIFKGVKKQAQKAIGNKNILDFSPQAQSMQKKNWGAMGEQPLQAWKGKNTNVHNLFLGKKGQGYTPITQDELVDKIDKMKNAKSKDPELQKIWKKVMNFKHPEKSILAKQEEYIGKLNQGKDMFADASFGLAEKEKKLNSQEEISKKFKEAQEQKEAEKKKKKKRGGQLDFGQKEIAEKVKTGGFFSMGTSEEKVARSVGFAVATAKLGLAIGARGEGNTLSNFEGYKRAINTGTSEYGGMTSWGIGLASNPMILASGFGQIGSLISGLFKGVG